MPPFISLMTALIATATAAEDVSITVEVARTSHGAVSGIVDAPIERVLDLIIDCDGADAWFPELVATHTVAPGRCGGGTNLPWPVTDRTWQIDVHPAEVERGWDVSFAYVAGTGNLARMDGAYHLEPLADGRTRVTYEVWIDLGFWVPDPLVAWATRRVLPGILQGLEAEAGRMPLVASALSRW